MCRHSLRDIGSHKIRHIGQLCVGKYASLYSSNLLIYVQIALWLYHCHKSIAFIFSPLLFYLFYHKEKSLNRLLEYNEKIQKSSTVIINGDIILSTDYRLVIIQNHSIMLQRKEFEIFKMLITSPRRVFTYKQIYREVWGRRVC